MVDLSYSRAAKESDRQASFDIQIVLFSGFARSYSQCENVSARVRNIVRLMLACAIYMQICALVMHDSFKHKE